MNKRNMMIIGFVLLTVLLRLIPHPPNFSPIIALALFGSTTFTNKWIGLTLPIIVMGLSDLYLGFSYISFWVYSSFFLISLMGIYWKNINTKNIIGSSLLFFIITNFGVWTLGGYTHDINGLILCYIMAIPFLINSILGDLFFSYILKYSFKYSESQRIPKYIHQKFNKIN